MFPPSHEQSDSSNVPEQGFFFPHRGVIPLPAALQQPVRRRIFHRLAFLDGDIDEVVDALITDEQAEKMKNL